MLNENEKEALRDRTVDVLLELRSAYLRTSTPNILKHWDMLQDRTRAAAMSTSSVEEWVTHVSRSLRLGPPNPACSVTIGQLASAVRDRKAAREWLQLIEDEYGYLMAKAREISELKKKEKADV